MSFVTVRKLKRVRVKVGSAPLCGKEASNIFATHYYPSRCGSLRIADKDMNLQMLVASLCSKPNFYFTILFQFIIFCGRLAKLFARMKIRFSCSPCTWILRRMYLVRLFFYSYQFLIRILFCIFILSRKSLHTASSVALLTCGSPTKIFRGPAR